MFVGGDGTVVAVSSLNGEGKPDLATVDSLARLQLAARQLGGTIEVQEMCLEMAELLELVGLRGELGGEAEGGEQVGVEEGVEPGDPIA